ncbi:hypothetical protein EYF80_023889 [Liparis tanakae]|uniref:Uncharacterized protein n=1 Tax=Liparis tanakae TaxID=230148 RepID=A0A4Z2HJ06_9TELE|nr:hypothetical protein EYF80_023889 [Liparis tanakae]
MELPTARRHQTSTKAEQIAAIASEEQGTPMKTFLHTDRQTDRQTDRAPLASGGTDKLLDFALSAVGVAKRPEIKIAGLRDEHSGVG